MDIVEKLRDIDAVGRIEDCGHSARDCAEAADEIERLRLVVAELAKYFTSGNCVPVERATILAKDFWRITGLEPSNGKVTGAPPHGAQQENER